MPWFNEFDPDVPQDIESAAEGAERIRETRRGLVERLSTVFRGFPADHPDREGEAMLFPSAGAMVGTHAQRPNVPDREGHIWFSTDRSQIFIGDRNLVWRGPFGIATPSEPGGGEQTALAPYRAMASRASDFPFTSAAYIPFEFTVHAHPSSMHGVATGLSRFQLPSDGVPVGYTSIITANIAVHNDHNTFFAPVRVRLYRAEFVGFWNNQVFLHEIVKTVSSETTENFAISLVDHVASNDPPIAYRIQVERVSSSGTPRVVGGRATFSIGQLTGGFGEQEEPEEPDYDYDY